MKARLNPTAVALALVSISAAFVWMLWKSAPPNPAYEPDITPLREVLQKEAEQRLGGSLDTPKISVSLNQVSREKAFETLRARALLLLEETPQSSDWLFQGTLQELQELRAFLGTIGTVQPLTISPVEASSTMVIITLIHPQQ